LIHREPRELTESERAAIRKLVTSMCANYDRTYGCLPLDEGCYMLTKWWTGSMCTYFRNAVLPLDPVLEAYLTGAALPEQSICKICKKSFSSANRQVYCSFSCQSEGNRRMSRERMRKKRQRKTT